MKNHKFLIVLVLFTAFNLNAQDKELFITYKFEKKKIDHKSLLFHESYSIQNINVYAYGKDLIIKRIRGIARHDYVDGKIVPIIPDTIFRCIKIDYTKNYLRTEETIRTNIILEEKLDLFNWNLTKESKSILGYHCTKAECHFRGRDYVVYFTTEIPFKATPWKFHGLPGVILEAYSKDEYCKWKATSLTIRKYKNKKKPVWRSQKIVNLEQFITLLKEHKKNTAELKKRADLITGKPFIERLKVNWRIEAFDLNLNN